MRSILTWFLAAGLGLWAAPSVAGPFEDALVAAQAGEFATAVSLLRPLAEAGEPAAQYNLGILYENGGGVEQDYVEAAYLYGLAARQGHGGAQMNLGALYGNGRGVVRDFSEAFIWLSLASAQGNPEAPELRDLAAGQLSAEELTAARVRSGTYWDQYVVPFQ
jgi:TPR repeat protein